MLRTRHLRVALGIGLFALAACESVHTQATTNEPPLMVAPPAEQATPAAPAAGDGKVVPKSSYNRVDVDGPYVAITFDDGPSATLTPQLLDMLKARGMHATFYVVGENAERYPDILKRMVAEGHEIGNHSYNHPAFTKLGADGVRSQIQRTSDAITAATGTPPKTLRPPYGATSPYITHRINEEFGMKVIMWQVDPLDWKYRDSGRVSAAIIKEAKPGDIILAHDIHATTVAAMPATFDALLAKGYKFVTVSELIALEQPRKAAPANTPAKEPAPEPAMGMESAPEQPAPAPAATPSFRGQ